MLIDIATSTLSSTARGWRGTSAMVRTAQPEHWLVLYDMEGCPYCRTVREVLTELDLNVFIKPCPKGQPGFREELAQLSGKGQVPYLVDENTGQSMAGSDQITRYLYEKYGAESKPEKKGKFLQPLNKLATGLRFMRGLRGVKASRPEKPLILFSFESSPFSRLVRERLTELGLPYKLYNGGKQQLADQGLSHLRPVLGEYSPVPGTNRERLLREAGRVQFPFLEDPNTGEKLFESKHIIQYLNRTYQL
ncbi:glutathione S-transferase N-terminal domain-containing protein [uncultured Alcanivorax sp.]|uniref:glutathione S-transferase N-terminal domain-containing protein n=1 Tax=uncultured Alcanivorax sp. TaxID=191215 RepID=UPI0032B24249